MCIRDRPLSVRVDLDPPLVGNPIPQPGSRSQDVLPELSVEVSDALGGSGLDESSVSFVLDGDESISGYSLSGGKISYVPSEALSEGEHSFRVTVSDMAGNQTVFNSGNFVVDVTAPTIARTVPSAAVSYTHLTLPTKA